MSTALDSETTMQLVVLEEMFNEELHCESTHQESVCSVTVTHRSIGCTDPLVVCFNSAKNALNKMEEGGWYCGDCELPIEVCWRIIPI